MIYVNIRNWIWFNLVMAWRFCNIQKMAIGLLLLQSAAGYCEELPQERMCTANLAESIAVVALDKDGDIRLQDGRVLRLAGLDWPAQDQAEQRAALRQRWAELVMPGGVARRVSARITGEKDRWGRQAAQVFVLGPDTDPPVWLQGGLLSSGLVVAWPEPAMAMCWAAALAAETRARAAGSGLWSGLHQHDGSTLLRAGGDSPMSRRVVFESRVASVRPGRRVTFVNFAGPRDQTPSWMLSARQIRDFQKAGRDPATFVGKRLRLRADMELLPRPRLSVAGAQAVDIVE